MIRRRVGIVPFAAIAALVASSTFGADARGAAIEAEALDTLLVEQGYVCVPLVCVAQSYLATSVRVDEVELRLIVDTGAPATYFDHARTKALGSHWQANGPPPATSVCYVPTLQLTTLNTDAQWAWHHDLTEFNAALAAYQEKPVDGLLGNDVLKSHAAIIDYSSLRLYLQPIVDLEQPADASGSLRDLLRTRNYESIAFDRLESGYLALHVLADQVDLEMMIDSGAPCTHLDPARTLPLGFRWETVKNVPPIDGRARQTCRIETLSLCGIEAKQIQAWSHDLSDVNAKRADGGCGESVDGILGGDLFRKHAAVIDYLNNRLYLQPVVEKRFAIRRVKVERLTVE